MANVSIRDVRKTFGTTEVLHGVSVEIEDGEFVNDRHRERVAPAVG
jgi:ABC-type sugar transport system ATPase subunit